MLRRWYDDGDSITPLVSLCRGLIATRWRDDLVGQKSHLRDSTFGSVVVSEVDHPT